MSDSLCSIILPTLNSLSFLEERIETILAQSHENWECIAIDGESTDGTWQFLENLSKRDNRFTLHSAKAWGPYDAWNKGIEMSNGAFIYIDG